jgi:transcriptional regulator with GAF, ATPase, and Fis domain
MTMVQDMAATFAEIATALHEEPGVDGTVEAVLRFALDAVGCTHAGVMMVTDNRRRVESTATDPLVEKADHLQIEYQEGPCLSAIVEHESFRVRDTATESRWPNWSPKVAELGLHSALGIRLHATSTTIGSLNLFHTEPNAFDDDDEAVAHILARHASLALAAAKESETLTRAIDARNLIGQAQGLLMERFDLSSEQAFAVLRRYSQDHNIKLREVAKKLIDTRRLPV